MQKITRSIYIVEAGEKVTLEIEAFKVGYFTTFVVDGKLIPNVPGSDPLTYQPFTVTVGAGLTHFGRVDCHFPTNAPDDAHYQLFLTGDKGGGRFEGSDIKKSNLSWVRGLEFRRV
jgi:hypothetical protein